MHEVVALLCECGWTPELQFTRTVCKTQSTVYDRKQTEQKLIQNRWRNKKEEYKSNKIV